MLKKFKPHFFKKTVADVFHIFMELPKNGLVNGNEKVGQWMCLLSTHRVLAVTVSC